MTAVMLALSIALSSSVPQVAAQLKWPDGTYALPLPEVGCPFIVNNQFSWSPGWVLQDTENDKNEYQHSGTRNLWGTFGSDMIVTQFCTKTTNDTDSGKQWPKGSYCIVKSGSCPGGFEEGSIFWDDQDDDNRNTCGGEGLPDGSFGTDTQIDYCCRNDGSPKKGISLPYITPFYLMRQSSSGCQKVRRMTVTEEYLQWDDENENNKDAKSGMHPYEDGDGENHRLHYCFYQPKPQWVIRWSQRN